VSKLPPKDEVKPHKVYRTRYQGSGWLSCCDAWGREIVRVRVYEKAPRWWHGTPTDEDAACALRGVKLVKGSSNRSLILSKDDNRLLIGGRENHGNQEAQFSDRDPDE
jgi:hypothetical protein